MTTTINYEQIVNGGLLYMNGMVVSNDATTPNTKLNISAGICRDTTNQFDMILGNYLGGTSEITIANVSTTLNMGVNGVNGLDTGSIGASKVYAIYVIADPQSYNPVATIASLSLTGPLMPFGYGSWRICGFAVSDGSSHFLPAYISGNANARKFTYDSPQATSVTAGTSANYAAISLAALVPAFNNTPVLFRANWTANAAADTFNMQAGNATGDEWTLIAPVAGGTAHTVGFGTVLSQLVATVPTSNYKVSAIGGVAINVASFDFYV